MQAARIVERPSGNGTPILQAIDKDASQPDQKPSVSFSRPAGSSSTTSAPATKPKGASETRSKTIVLTDAGRAPWYNAAGEPVPAYVVGIAGGSASGKTSVARSILKSLPNVPWVAIVSQDAYYKSLTPEQSKLAFKEQYDFDHPDAFDYDILKQCIQDLRCSKAVEIPVYSFVQHQRTAETTYLYGPAVLIVEGIFVLHDPEIRQLLDLKVYVQADSDLMLARRIKRDIVERGRSVNSVIDQYLRYVKPAFDNFVSVTARHADMIVPGANNEVAIEVISQHMEKQLRSRSMKLRAEFYKTPAVPPPMNRQTSFAPMSPFEGLGSALERKSSLTPLHSKLNSPNLSSPSSSFSALPPSATTATTTATAQSGVATGATTVGLGLDSASSLPPNVILLPQTPQLQSLLTILHDRSTPTSEFTFACKRVGTLVVELATTLLPYRTKQIEIHGGRTHVGHELNVDTICSVSILRSGAVLEPSLRRAFPAMSLGSLLIQSNDEDGEPHLYDVALPSFIRARKTASKSWVFLLDAQIGTGAAAFMAIRVLLDHSVPEQQIVFLTLLASSHGGIHALNRAFPRVRIVVAGIDPGLQKLRIPWQTSSSTSTSTSTPASLHRSDVKSTTTANIGENDAAAIDQDDLSPGFNNIHLLASPPLLSIDAAKSKLHTSNPGSLRTDSVVKGTRVVFAITPGCGSIGDRFWGTGAR
ncbi:hypothetical protein BCV70DRAFT_201924 [Testicularia cyperi]|uniref:Uridine kinase n=1 Tax=Testicularia cyperi TaxID=1882483 RepID=A0A317XLB6_9BASI|nr:hypothetical protein BCV70DRAFT_201924 [Testicularia cyperi]